jgi:hypothetical protein
MVRASSVLRGPGRTAWRNTWSRLAPATRSASTGAMSISSTASANSFPMTPIPWKVSATTAANGEKPNTIRKNSSMISSGIARRMAWTRREVSYSKREGVMLRAASGNIAIAPMMPKATLRIAMHIVTTAARTPPHSALRSGGNELGIDVAHEPLGPEQPVEELAHRLVQHPDSLERRRRPVADLARECRGAPRARERYLAQRAAAHVLERTALLDQGDLLEHHRGLAPRDPELLAVQRRQVLSA